MLPTKIGIIVSIFVLISIVFSCLFLGQDMYLKQIPIVSMEDDLLTDYPEDIISNEDILKCLTIQDLNMRSLYLSRYLDVTPDYWISDNISSNTTYLDIDKCNYISPESSIYFNNVTCIQNLNHSLYGYWFTNQTKYITFRVSLCKNTTKNNNRCYSNDQIAKKIQMKNFIFRYSTNNL